MTEGDEVSRPEVRVLEEGETYGKFAIEPLERGYGVTLGNPLRRALLNSLPGAAVTWVKIEGILHEYTIIPHVKEEVMDFLLNVKSIRLRPLSERPARMRLEVSGEGKVCAGDIMTSSDLEIVNPELSLASMDSPEAKLSVEFNVELGKGYLPAGHGNGLPIGVLPVDAIFTPVRKVNYTIERTRVGQRTDYERLVLEIWTDGSIDPTEALKKTALILVEQFFLFTRTGKGTEAGEEGPSLAATIPAEQYNMAVERLELSSRTVNSLKRANINKVGEVLEVQASDLLKIRNFGEKSLSELYRKLRELGLLPEPSQEEGSTEEAEAPAAAAEEPTEIEAPVATTDDQVQTTEAEAPAAAAEEPTEIEAPVATTDDQVQTTEAEAPAAAAEEPTEIEAPVATTDDQVQTTEAEAPAAMAEDQEDTTASDVEPPEAAEEEWKEAYE